MYSNAVSTCTHRLKLRLRPRPSRHRRRLLLGSPGSRHRSAIEQQSPRAVAAPPMPAPARCPRRCASRRAIHRKRRSASSTRSETAISRQRHPCASGLPFCNCVILSRGRFVRALSACASRHFSDTDLTHFASSRSTRFVTNGGTGAVGTVVLNVGEIYPQLLL